MSEATQTEKKQAQKERKAYRAKKRKLFFKTLFSRKIVLVSAIVVLLIILIAIFADFLMPYNPNQISIPERNQGMSAAHWLGTDEYGRDLLSRVIAGSRVSLIVGLLAVIIACVTWPTPARNSQPSSPQKPCGQVPRTVDSVDKSAVDHRASPAGFEFSTGSQGTKHRPGQEIRESSTLCTGVMMTEKGKTSPSLLSLRLGTCG